MWFWFHTIKNDNNSIQNFFLTLRASWPDNIKYCFIPVHQPQGTGREERGGFRMGNTCIPMADSCWYMAKPIQYCKVKKWKKMKKKYCFTHIYDGVINKMLFILMYSIKNQWEMNRKKKSSITKRNHVILVLKQCFFVNFCLFFNWPFSLEQF